MADEKAELAAAIGWACDMIAQGAPAHLARLCAAAERLAVVEAELEKAEQRYADAVTGRKEFREMYRQERERCKQLEEERDLLRCAKDLTEDERRCLVRECEAFQATLDQLRAQLAAQAEEVAKLRAAQGDMAVGKAVNLLYGPESCGSSCDRDVKPCFRCGTPVAVRWVGSPEPTEILMGRCLGCATWCVFDERNAARAALTAGAKETQG